jgi:catechol 2,3-dioxygenase-like lactoylglutathione lyase family enzyme
MTVRLDHLALAARDAHESATFLAEILDLPDPHPSGPFLAVEVNDTLTIDYAAPPFEFPGQHLAFLVSETDFDAIRARLDARGVTYYPEPGYHDAGTINHNHGGRGLYFDDPGGHHLEVLTRRYGSEPSPETAT